MGGRGRNGKEGASKVARAGLQPGGGVCVGEKGGSTKVNRAEQGKGHSTKTHPNTSVSPEEGDHMLIVTNQKQKVRREAGRHTRNTRRQMSVWFHMKSCAVNQVAGMTDNQRKKKGAQRQRTT